MELSVELFGKDKIQVDSQPLEIDFPTACESFVRKFSSSSEHSEPESLGIGGEHQELPVVLLDVKTPSISTTPRKLYNEITRSSREFVGPNIGEPRLVEWSKCEVKKQVLAIVDHWNQTQHHRIRRSVVGSFRMNRIRLKNPINGSETQMLRSSSQSSLVISSPSPSLSETSGHEMEIPTMPSTPRSAIESTVNPSLVKISELSVSTVQSASPPSNPLVLMRDPIDAAPSNFLPKSAGVTISPSPSNIISTKTSNSEEGSGRLEDSEKARSLKNNHNIARNHQLSTMSESFHNQNSPRNSHDSATASGRSSVEVHLGPLKPTKVQEKLNDDQKVDAIVKRLPDLSFMLS